MQIATKKFVQKLIVFLGVIFTIISVSLITINSAFLMTNEICQGISVAGIPVGGLSMQAAEAKIHSVITEHAKTSPITLVYQDRSWYISAHDIELTFDTASLAQQAYDVGRSGNLIYRLKERYLATNQGYSVPLKHSYNHEKLLTLLLNIAKSIDHEPKNATIAYNGSDIKTVPERIGLQVDITKTVADIDTRLNTDLSFTIPLTVNDCLPAIRTNDLSQIDGMIASYTTQFDPANNNRNENIALAAKNISGVLVRAGDTFSFNSYVGPRLAQNGYKEAPVLINNKLVPGWGGGVCQVSSTLYNAVLLADLQIEERTSHSRPPAYVPLGQDATVADNIIDFKFKNTFPHNIYITNDIVGDKITFYIFGTHGSNTQSPQITVKAADTKVLEPNTSIKQDPELELGKQVIEVEGQRGFHVTTYRIKTLNGKEIGRELLSTDEYIPVEQVIRVGTKVPLKQPLK